MTKAASSSNIVTVTHLALQKIREAIPKEGSVAGLRISATRGDDGQVTYGLELEDTARAGDMVAKHGNVNFFIDRKSIEHLQGARIDYVRTKNGTGFVIRKPGGCECGPNCGCQG